MAGSYSSGRRSGKRPSSSFVSSNSHGKRRSSDAKQLRKKLSRQTNVDRLKNTPSHGAGSLQESKALHSRHQRSARPAKRSSSTDALMNSRLERLNSASNSPAQRPSQLTDNRVNRQNWGNSRPDQAYLRASTSARQQAYSGQPKQPSPRTARDIRLGPDPRRRPQLSSNPAFGRSRSPQRPGAEIIMPQASSQAYSPHPLSSGQGNQYSPLNNPSVTNIETSTEARIKTTAVPQRQKAALVNGRTQSLRPHSARRSKRSRGRGMSRPRLSSSPVPALISPGALAPANPHQPQHQMRQSASPLVYAARLLILGIGLGAIAGTLISALDPSSVPRRLGQREASSPSIDRLPETEARLDDIGTSPSGLPLDSSQQSRRSQSDTTTSTSSNIVNPKAVPKRSSLTALANQLQTMANNQPELTPGVFALDLDTYNYVDLNGATTFSAASIIKVPILIAFLQDVEQNKISLDEILVMEEGDVAGGSGNMRLGTIGDTYSAIETAKKMIIISDNTATNMLIRRMGGIEPLNQRFRSWGLTATTLRNLLPDLEGTNTTAPSEMTYLMALISQGKLLETGSRERMLDIMTQTETATLIPAGIGDNASAAHKTGDIGSMVGDTGVVNTSSGKRYAITVMMRRPHNDNRAQELIRQMVGVIHRELHTPSVPMRTPSLESSTGAVNER
ncbi:MAG: serine hydrolase [Cyanobacteria bacterium P01_F01_bin.150]